MLFSIVVPVYNVEKYIKECIDSVLSQTCINFELILVDDGSKDLSGAICDEYAAKDSRIKVIHKENGGQSTARNAGLSVASGDYVFFMDSDDFLTYNGFFDDIYKTMDENTDIVIFRYQKYYNEQKVVPVGTEFSKMNYSNSDELLYELVKHDTFYCSCWTKFIKTSILKDNNIIFDESLCCEDMDWYYQVVQRAKEFKVLDKICINYRQREGSVTAVFKKKSVTDFIFTIDKWINVFGDLENSKRKEVLLSSLAKLYCNLLIVYSIHYKDLKNEKEKIYSLKKLLKHNLNPRTSKIYLFYRFFGIALTCTIIRIINKAR